MAAPIRVLCVDDEKELAAVVAQYLSDNAEAMTATMATSGEDALATIASEQIDCVISDYQMPEMNGLELLETIRSANPEMPFILFTGRGSENVAGKAVRAGVSDYIPKRTGTDQFELLENRVRNVVERHHARQTTRELFNAATDAIFVHDPSSGEIIDVNEAGAELWDSDPSTLIGTDPGALVAADTDARGWLPTGETASDPRDWECVATDGTAFWAEVRVREARIDGEMQLLSICRNVTRRKDREHRLGKLLTAAEELMTHRSLEDIGSVVTDTMTRTLGFAGSMMYVVSDDEGLRQIGESGEVDESFNVDQLAATSRNDDGSLLGDGGVPLASTSDSGSLYYWPIASHGLLVGHLPDVEPTGFRRDLTDLLIAISKAAVVRTIQDERLAAQHEELDSLNRVNEVIRDINQTLVKVSTRDEIEQLVCKQLASASPFVCAWIGDHDLTREQIDIRVSSGRGATDIQDDDILTDDDGNDPLGDAIEVLLTDREVLIIDELDATSIGSDRASVAEEHGYESLTLIPITYQNALYDILAVYAEEVQPFGADERAVLSELGETIGYAMHTAERSRALLSDTTVELEYDIRDDTDIILGLSDHFQTTVELERIFFSADNAARLFVSVEDTQYAPVRDYVENARGDASIREISSTDDGTVVEIALDGLSMMKHLAEAMATIRSVTGTEGEGRMIVEIPTAVSVRTLTENLEDVFDHVSLLARRQRDPDDQPLSDVSQAADMGLTDRQHEVLLTAYHAGFFSWPRESTGEEIAELLDISQPTFHEHLRTGERKLLDLLFEHRRSVYT